MIIPKITAPFEAGLRLDLESVPPLQERHPSVLVVDDDVAICRLLMLLLSNEHYRIQTCQSVAEAFAIIDQELFDIYLLDCTLTDGAGLDVAERIRSKGSEAPIILLSGCDPSAVELRAKNLRIFDVIEKPFSRATICNALKTAVRPHGATFS